MTSFLHLTTPVNLTEERELFFASKTYNPIFHYTWQDKPNEEYSHSDPLKNKLYAAIIEQNHQAITTLASQLFVVDISDALHSLAVKEISNQSRIVFTGSAPEYAKLLKVALKEFDIEYQVIITPDHGFNVRPQHEIQTIMVSEALHCELFSMEGEVRHELAHVLRYVNGEYNHIKRSAYYLPTEEGLASYVQDHYPTRKDRSLAQHAIEYIGSEIGIRGSLRDIFDFMIESGMSKELAWKRATRHKFGFVDTSKPGDIMKPAMYFANEIKVSQLTTGEEVRLFVGKIAVQELPLHPTYQGLWPAEKLINYFSL